MDAKSDSYSNGNKFDNTDSTSKSKNDSTEGIRISKILIIKKIILYYVFAYVQYN